MFDLGIDIDQLDEYGSTCVHLGVAKLDINTVRCLIEYCEGVDVRDFAGASTLMKARGMYRRLNAQLEEIDDTISCVERKKKRDIVKAGVECDIHRCETIIKYLREQGFEDAQSDLVLESAALALLLNIGASCDFNPPLKVTLVSAKSHEELIDHPSLGAFYVENCISPKLIDFLLTTYTKLPLSSQRERKVAVCSLRKYYHDFSATLALTLSNSLSKVGMTGAVVFSNVRFLDYNQPGSELPAHIDLCKVEPLTGRRSTHTILLYLSDFEFGGETALLLEEKNGESGLNVICDVGVKAGRCLVFDHNTPHCGRLVRDGGKKLIRTECYFQ